MLNPIFTFLTFFGLIVTIVIQRIELKLSREEYKRTADSLGTQAIETTFFNLLDLHHKIVDNLHFDHDLLMLPPSKFENTSVFRSAEKVNGRNVFESFLKAVTEETEKTEDILIRYEYLNVSHNHILGHYFRNLYQSLKLIDSYDNAVLSEKEKKKYTSILRAQLSSRELSLLFLNCLDDIVDNGEFRNLLIRYEILEHMPIMKKDNKYYIVDIREAFANDDMIIQYRKEVKIKLDLKKYFGGAFGKHSEVQYNM